VDCAAGLGHALPERLLDRVHAAPEGGQQRRMNVEHPVLEGGDEGGAQDPVVTGVDQQLDAE